MNTIQGVSTVRNINLVEIKKIAHIDLPFMPIDVPLHVDQIRV